MLTIFHQEVVFVEMRFGNGPLRSYEFSVFPTLLPWDCGAPIYLIAFLIPIVSLRARKEGAYSKMLRLM